jgi:pyruvate-formate lyase
MTATAERMTTGEIDVRGFIQANYTLYEGDAQFLSGPTPRTTALWHRLTEMFIDERARGIYDVDRPRCRRRPGSAGRAERSCDDRPGVPGPEPRPTASSRL